MHGDVLHSRPAVVDYGGSIGTVVFYGANDGMLHAVDGNRTGATPGQELWAFVPSEVFGRFKRLRDNLPEIKFPVTPPAATTLPRDYFVDGSVTVYQKLDSAQGHRAGDHLRHDAPRRSFPLCVRRHDARPSR